MTQIKPAYEIVPISFGDDPDNLGGLVSDDPLSPDDARAYAATLRAHGYDVSTAPDMNGTAPGQVWLYVSARPIDCLYDNDERTPNDDHH